MGGCRLYGGPLFACEDQGGSTVHILAALRPDVKNK